MTSAFSRASELAIRAALYLALQPPGKVSPVHEIARGTGLPGPYLAKIMGPLIRAGLVRAFRGPGGGIELGQPPESISLRSVVRAVEGAVHREWCVLGLRACTPDHSCPLHPQWSRLRGEMERLLEETTLGSVVRGLRGNVELGPESWVRNGAGAARRGSLPRGRHNSR